MSVGQRFRDADEALRLRLIPYNAGTLSSDHPPGYNFLVLCLLPYREKKKNLACVSIFPISSLPPGEDWVLQQLKWEEGAEVATISDCSATQPSSCPLHRWCVPRTSYPPPGKPLPTTTTPPQFDLGLKAQLWLISSALLASLSLPY